MTDMTDKATSNAPTFDIPPDVQAALDRALSIPLSEIVDELEALIIEVAAEYHEINSTGDTEAAQARLRKLFEEGT